MHLEKDAIFTVERTLFHTLLDVTGHHYFDLFTYQGRVLVFRLLKAAASLKSKHRGASEWLEAAAAEFTEILQDSGYMSDGDAHIFPASVAAMKADIVANRVDLTSLSLDDLGVYASPDSALKMSSIHNAKGREYEAVALIDLQDGAIPSVFAQTNERREEQKRLFYVGITRAKKYLMYGTTTPNRRGPSPYLKDAGFDLG